MRHGNRIKKLGRTHAHRKATMAALSTSLLEHKRITTTLPKAKALRSFVEPIINRAKEDTTQNRRQVFRRLQSKEAVKTLFGEVAEVLGDRPGGYTRVVKLGQRAGDAAEMAIIELVDFNDVKPGGVDSGKKKTRRSRAKSTGAAAPAAVVADEAVEDVEEVVEDVVEVTDEEVADVIEDASAEIDEAIQVFEEEVVEAVADKGEVIEATVAEEEVIEAAVEEDVNGEVLAEAAVEIDDAVVEDAVAVVEVDTAVDEAAETVAEEAAPEGAVSVAPSDAAETNDVSDDKEKAE